MNRALFENGREYRGLRCKRFLNLRCWSKGSFNGGCNKKDAMVEGRELTGGGLLQYGRTPLYMAAWKGSAAVAQVLLVVGANTEAHATVRERRGGQGR